MRASEAKASPRTVLITGAARGQGEAEARAFAAQGDRVVLGDVCFDEAEALAVELGPNAMAVHLDVSEEAHWTAAIDATLEWSDRLDVLVNNAGVFRTAEIVDESLAAFETVLSINLLGAFLGMRAATPALRASSAGAIVNVGSTSGFSGMPGHAAYGSSKWALRGLTRIAAVELAPDIRVNLVAPGPVATDMLPTPIDALAQTIPLQMVADPSDIAHLVVFLASDDARFVTGAEMVIDGGTTLVGRAFRP